MARSPGDLDPAQRLALLLRERERRQNERAAAAAATAHTIAALRGPQEAHPKQRAACRSKSKRRAVLCTRRSGKTSGGNREELARALEQPGFRCTYCHTTLGEAKKLAWRSDTLDGWIDLVQKHGELVDKQTNTYRLGGTTAKVNETELTIAFGNGSLLDIFAADDPAGAEKFRGRAKHRVRIDEAQKFPELKRFCTAIVGPALSDYEGELELDGTPGEDCAGYFYDITKPDDHDGSRETGWELHAWSVVDNPFFGATPEERWARTAAIALTENGWTEDDPTFQREWLGRWVRTDARYVYAVHARAEATQAFAPLRLSDGWRQLAPLVRGMTPQLLAVLAETGWYDHAASLQDLPAAVLGRREWYFGIGMDFGHDPDPVAVAVEAFTPDLPDVLEMFSWKRTGLVPDDWRCIAELLFLQISDGLVVMVGDPGGLVGAELTAWRERLGIPMEASDKAGKASWIEMMNGDIRRGRFRYRAGSPLLDEHKHLVWAPTVAGRRPKEHADRRLPDGRIPGNHCSDAGLYFYRHLSAHLHRPPPPPESQDALEERGFADARAAPPRRDDMDGLLPMSMLDIE